MILRPEIAAIFCASALGAIGIGVLPPSAAAAASVGPSVTQQKADNSGSSIVDGPDGALWFANSFQIGRLTTGGEVSYFGIGGPVGGGGSLPAGVTGGVDDIAVGSDGALWFSLALSGQTDQIGRVTTSGQVSYFPLTTKVPADAQGGVGGITSGPDGALWFTDQTANAIGRMTTSGQVTEFPIPTANSDPHDIITGPDGALWFTEFIGNKVGRINAQGQITEFNASPSQDWFPDLITSGPDGALWYTQPLQGGVGRMTTTGQVTEYPGVVGDQPQGLVTGHDGALWLTDAGPRNAPSLVRLSMDGTAVRSDDSTFQTNSDAPKAITVGPDDALWFTADGAGYIGRFGTPGATQSGSAGSTRSSIAAALVTPSEAFASPKHTAGNALIAMLIVIFVAFPTALFNRTFEENYEDISRWWRRALSAFGFDRLVFSAQRVSAATLSAPGAALPPPVGAPVALAPPSPVDVDHGAASPATAETAVEGVSQFARLGHQARVAVVIGVGALFGAMLDPNFGLNRASVLGFVALVFAILLGVVVPAVTKHVYNLSHGMETSFAIVALPAGLVVALACLLVSRLSHFQPGYLYGVVLGVSFAASLRHKEKAHTVALALLATLASALIAWVLWIPVDHAAAHPGANWPVVFADDLLAAVFVGGITASVIEVLPIRFMPGRLVVAWNKVVWALIALLAVFILVAVMLNPSLGGHPGTAPLTTAIILFILFGGGSVAFYWYFNRRARRSLFAPAPTGSIPNS